MIRIAINGMGRIGRSAFKIAFDNPDVDLVAVNDLMDAATLAHLLTFDTAYGIYNQRITHDEGELTVSGRKILVLNEKDPSKLPWTKLKIDVVIESTGVFTDEEGLRKHLHAGAQKVILSAPAKKGSVPTYVLGVNDDKYHGEKILNNASCTTNSIAPVADIIEKNLGIKRAMMTTVHAYTADQNLQDAPHKDLRRARAAAENIVPTTTGAAIAAAETIPALKDKFDGMALRVPVAIGSLSDLVFLVDKRTSVEQVNKLFVDAAADTKYKDILTVTDSPIVSSDIVGNPHSAIVDLSLTKVVGGDFIKVIAWYDNEWGYSNRLIETAIMVSKKA